MRILDRRSGPCIAWPIRSCGRGVPGRPAGAAGGGWRREGDRRAGPGAGGVAVRAGDSGDGRVLALFVPLESQPWRPLIPDGRSRRPVLYFRCRGARVWQGSQPRAERQELKMTDQKMCPPPRHSSLSLSVGLVLMVASRSAWATCPSPYDSASCEDVCSRNLAGNYFECDLTTHGESGNGFITAVYSTRLCTSVNHYCAWGTDEGGRPSAASSTPRSMRPTSPCSAAPTRTTSTSGTAPTT